MKIAGIVLLVCSALLLFRSLDAVLAGAHQRSNVIGAVLPATESLLEKIEDQGEKSRKKEEIIAAASLVVQEVDGHLVTFGLCGFAIGAIQTGIGLYLVTRPKSKHENHGAEPGELCCREADNTTPVEQARRTEVT